MAAAPAAAAAALANFKRHHNNGVSAAPTATAAAAAAAATAAETRPRSHSKIVDACQSLQSSYVRAFGLLLSNAFWVVNGRQQRSWRCRCRFLLRHVITVAALNLRWTVGRMK